MEISHTTQGAYLSGYVPCLFTLTPPHKPQNNARTLQTPGQSAETRSQSAQTQRKNVQTHSADKEKERHPRQTSGTPPARSAKAKFNYY